LHPRTVPIFRLVATPTIEETLANAERALAEGRGLSGTGFWRVVDEVKRDPELVELHAERIGAIDARAHRDWALLSVPLGWGTAIVAMATLTGLAGVWWAYYLDGWSAVIVFYVATGILLVATHASTHLVVGRLLGLRFTGWFIGKITQPQPGIKLDYASYLRTPASRRAWMHASGAIVTKLMPFLLLGAASDADLPVWALWGLVVVGAVALATDVVWSTRKSDWKKYRREMAIAQGP
jgi:hypothetical protein